MFLEEKTYNSCYYYDKLILLNRSNNYKNHSFDNYKDAVYSNIELNENQYILPCVGKYDLRKIKKLKNTYTVLIDLQLYKLNADKTLKKDIILKKNNQVKKYRFYLINIIEII